MLTSISRASSRRVLAGSTRSAAALASVAPQTLVIRQRAAAPAASTPITSARSFSVSSLSALPSGRPKKSEDDTAAPATKKPRKNAAKEPKKPKKKAPAAKKKPAAKKQKKELAPEEREKLKIKELKQIALMQDRPKLLPNSIWRLHMLQRPNTKADASGDWTFADMSRGNSEAFRNLSSVEREELAAKVAENKEANAQIVDQWVRTYPPELIYWANKARRRLAKLTGKPQSFPPIKDERLPKRGISGYVAFCTTRLAQRDASTPATTAIKESSEAWKALSVDEQYAYNQVAGAESEKKRQEVEELERKAKAYWKEKGIKL